MISTKLKGEVQSEVGSKFLSPPLLAVAKPIGRYKLDTDAWDKQSGCAMLQEPLARPSKHVGYSSWSLKMEEEEYGSTYRESFAVVLTVILLRLYLQVSSLTVRTDYKVLRRIMNVTDATGKPASGELGFRNSELGVLYLAEIKHKATDAVWRLPTMGNDDRPPINSVPLSTTFNDAISENRWSAW